MKKLHLIAFLVLLLSLHALAQDKIYKKNGEVIEATVLEIGVSEIKYKLFNDLNGPTYVLDKDRLKKTVYQNGREEIYFNSLKDPTLYEEQAKSALKINFLAPLAGYTQINFEHSIKPGRSYEFSLGIIGLGKRQALLNSYNGISRLYRDAAGIFVTGGYKFLTLPNFTRNGEKYSHILHGWYAKPEVIFGTYSQNNHIDTKNQIVNFKKETITMGAFILNLGKQWVLGDAFLIDVYAGLGYAQSNYITTANTYNNGSTNFVFTTSGRNSSGASFTGGFKIGVLLSKQNNKP